jgi:replicative DNA helicase
MQSEYGTLGLVVMDYIQKLGNRAAKNRAQAVGKFSGAFKDVAKEFGVPFVALAQINRGVENQSNKRPTMSDIKDSGDVEQDADLILLLYRDEYYNQNTEDKGIMEINIAKNRNGATGVCQVLFAPSTGSFHPTVQGGN